jgi:hypothetical protein
MLNREVQSNKQNSNKTGKKQESAFGANSSDRSP